MNVEGVSTSKKKDKKRIKQDFWTKTYSYKSRVNARREEVTARAGKSGGRHRPKSGELPDRERTRTSSDGGDWYGGLQHESARGIDASDKSVQPSKKRPRTANPGT